ncbi:MAG: Type 1 glutamine amidotransferase-like domain-containing protein [Candidatus Sericytochromatia bacterium]
MKVQKQIVALGGGGFSQEPDNLALDRYILSLAGRDRPRIAFVPTASGDADGYVERFYTAFRSLDCEPSHLGLFRREITDLRAYVLAQDILYVGGGNTQNMLALWRLHGLDGIFREAYERGVILAGISAGALCWFKEGTTDSLGALTRLECLDLLPHSLSVHHDAEPTRRPVFKRLIGQGEMVSGYGVDEGAALHVVDGELPRVVTSRPEVGAYWVERRGAEVVEEPLAVTFLGGTVDA